MGRKHRGFEVEQKISDYLTLAESDLSLPLSVSAVAKYVGCHRSSLYNYGIIEKVQIAQQKRLDSKKSERDRATDKLHHAMETIALLQGKLYVVELNASRLNIDLNELYK